MRHPSGAKKYLKKNLETIYDLNIKYIVGGNYNHEIFN